jgi:HEAT repeat protein
VRETAALALGVSRRVDAAPDLIALARDTAVGRKLLKGERVDDRTRAFALYGLGLIASAARGDRELQKQIFETATSCLDVDDRDVRVAAILAMSRLDVSASDPGGKRLLWGALEVLQEFWDRDLGRGDEIVQAHVPTAIARLLGRGTGVDHERLKGFLASALTDKQRRHDTVRQSAVLALGELALPGEDHPPDARLSELLSEESKEGKDEQTRYFALIALARIGGEANRAELLRALARGGKATVKPWAAIALGVLAFQVLETTGAPDAVVGRALQKTLSDVKNEEYLAAAAVALGLAGHRAAATDLRRLIDASRRRDILQGYACIGLALMGATEGIPVVRALVDEAVRRPFVVTQGAIALAKLGDKDAVPLLTELLADSESSLARLSGIANAFRFIGDKRAVDPLVSLLTDQGLTTLARAFVAAALGGVVDDDLLPWNTEYSVGANYYAAVDTLTNGVTGVLDIL